MRQSYRHLGKLFAIGNAAGLVVAGVWWILAPQPEPKALPGPWPMANSAAATPMEPDGAKHRDLETLAQALRAEILATPPERPLEPQGHYNSSQWVEWQVRLLANLEDPAKSAELAAQLKDLIDNAFLPDSEENLVEYVFYRWGQSDPVLALQLEAEIFSLPTQYWFAFNGIYAGWAEHAPFEALNSLLTRLEWDYLLDGKHYGINMVFAACMTADREAFLDKTVEAPMRVQEYVGNRLLQWRQQDASGFLNWLREHQDHPVTSNETFRRRLTNSSRKVPSLDQVLEYLAEQEEKKAIEPGP